MKIQVEFYGIPRQRAGVHATCLECPGQGLRLAEALQSLGERFPQFGQECLDTAGIRSAYIANLNGERFVTDPETLLRDRDALLIMSADAGG